MAIVSRHSGQQDFLKGQHLHYCVLSDLPEHEQKNKKKLGRSQFQKENVKAEKPSGRALPVAGSHVGNSDTGKGAWIQTDWFGPPTASSSAPATPSCCFHNYNRKRIKGPGTSCPEISPGFDFSSCSINSEQEKLNVFLPSLLAIILPHPLSGLPTLSQASLLPLPIQSVACPKYCGKQTLLHKIPCCHGEGAQSWEPGLQEFKSYLFHSQLFIFLCISQPLFMSKASHFSL